MDLKKKFAKAILDYWENTPKDCPEGIGLDFWGANAVLLAFYSVVLGVPTALTIFDSDVGAENEEVIAQQYNEVLEQLKQMKSEYNSLYNPHAEEADIAYITSSLQEMSARDNYETNLEKKVKWNKIIQLAEIFARDIQKEPKLSEDMAGELIEDFEENIIGFKTLGYKDTPDSDNLRECQKKYEDSMKINSCTDDALQVSDASLKKGATFGALVAFILITMPSFVANALVTKKGDVLERWAKGKKAPRRPKISPH